ncbi:VanZ family protein [Magnetococcales bacterium HHB-1]
MIAKKNAPYFWLFLLIAYSGLIFYLSSTPAEKLPPLFFPGFDKIIHALEYGLLAWIALKSVTSFPRIPYPYLFAWGYSTLYSISDEWHQSYVPGRHSDIFDLMADIFGATLLLALYHRYIKK